MPDAGQSEILIRPMVQGDLEAVVVIEQQVQPRPWTLALFADCLRPSCDCDVALVGERIAGFQIVSHVLDESHLLNVAVDPRWQGQGIGTLLLESGIARARAQRRSVIYLEVRMSNDAARRLYHRLGFVEAGYRRGYYQGPDGAEDACLMTLTLV